MDRGTYWKAKYHAHIRLYMEASLIANQLQLKEWPRLLVMEDYKFFKGFVRSAYAHDVLRDMVVSVLKLDYCTTRWRSHKTSGR